MFGNTVIEPADPTARPVYFARNDRTIEGPARPTHLAKTGVGASERFWVIVRLADGHVVWVREDRLRSKQQFLEQRPLRPVERIRTPK